MMGKHCFEIKLHVLVVTNGWYLSLRAWVFFVLYNMYIIYS